MINVSSPRDYIFIDESPAMQMNHTSILFLHTGLLYVSFCCVFN